MIRPKTDVLQGTLALLVLKTLARYSMHGYGITLHIQMLSKEVLRVEEGSLYPALHRMAQDGWIKAEWGTSKIIAAPAITALPLWAASSLRKKKRIGPA